MSGVSDSCGGLVSSAFLLSDFSDSLDLLQVSLYCLNVEMSGLTVWQHEEDRVKDKQYCFDRCGKTSHHI